MNENRFVFGTWFLITCRCLRLIPYRKRICLLIIRSSLPLICVLISLMFLLVLNRHGSFFLSCALHYITTKRFIWDKSHLFHVMTSADSGPAVVSSRYQYHLYLGPILQRVYELIIEILTHWDRYKMAAISQTTFSSAFPWMKTFEFWIKIHLNMFLMV